MKHKRNNFQHLDLTKLPRKVRNAIDKKRDNLDRLHYLCEWITHGHPDAMRMYMGDGSYYFAWVLNFTIDDHKSRERLFAYSASENQYYLYLGGLYWDIRGPRDAVPSDAIEMTWSDFKDRCSDHRRDDYRLIPKEMLTPEQVAYLESVKGDVQQAPRIPYEGWNI